MKEAVAESFFSKKSSDGEFFNFNWWVSEAPFQALSENLMLGDWDQ